MAIIELILKFFFVDFVFPLALKIATRRESDEVFKAKTDEAYKIVKTAKTTAERKAAARALYELQKNG